MPKVEERVTINNTSELQHHFDSTLPALQLVESEDTWQKIEKSLIKLEVITKSGGYKYELFPSLFKSVAQPVINSLLSERTKLSGTAADLLNSVAPRLGDRFESLVNVFVPPLLLSCARTNKVALVRAKKCLLLIAKHCKLISLLPHLREASKDKSITARAVSVEVTLMLLESIENKDRIGKRVTDLETIIKGTATDRDPEVRQWCKKVFELYIDTWPDRVLDFTSTFTPTTRRYLAPAKGSSATTMASARLSPPPAARRQQQQPKEHVVKLKATTSKPRTHLAPISVNATPTTITPLASKQTKAASKVQRVSSAETVDIIPAASRKASGSAPIINPQEEKQRAILRAELLKQATGTPSQSVAARLALEKFEYQMKKSQQLEVQEEEAAPEHRETDRMLFNVAMSKKQSPRKGPSRVIVVAPSNAIRKVSKGAAASTSAQCSGSSRLQPKKVEAEEPDVFRSRPIGNVRALQTISTSSPKVSSSISRGLGAREKLLGPSMRAGNASGKLLSSRSLQGVKKGSSSSSSSSTLKIDVGKENIPPGSMLALIAEPPSESASPQEEVVHEHEIADKPVSNLKAAIASAPIANLQEVCEPIQVSEIEDNAAKELLPISRAITPSEDTLKEDAAKIEPVADESDKVQRADGLKETSVDAALIPLPPSPEVDSEVEIETPLSDWTLMSAALQEDMPTSAPAESNDKIQGPFMSTPLRQPPSAMQYKTVISSLSSPLRAISQVASKEAAVEAVQFSPKKKKSPSTPSAHLRKIFSIVASRKM